MGSALSGSQLLPTPSSAATRRSSAPPPIVRTPPSPQHTLSVENVAKTRKHSSPEVGNTTHFSIISLVQKRKNNQSSTTTTTTTTSTSTAAGSSGARCPSSLTLEELYPCSSGLLGGLDAFSMAEEHVALLNSSEQSLATSNLASCLSNEQLNLESLKEMLRCVSCRRFLFPPILQCVAGHMCCKSCFRQRAACSVCSRKMLEVPAKFAEMITEQFKVPCAHHNKGCQQTIPFKNRRSHEEVCPFKPVQCPEFDCNVSKPMNEIFRHFRLDHQHHFVNAHGRSFAGDIRCDDANMVMGVERKWAPTMLKIDEDDGPVHFFLEILRTKHGVWHIWVWHLGEPSASQLFRCEIAIRRRMDMEPELEELRYSGRVHSIRIPPHRVILSGCLLSFSDYSAQHFRHRPNENQHHVIDYCVNVSRGDGKNRKHERTLATGISKMLRRFSVDNNSKDNQLVNKKNNLGISNNSAHLGNNHQMQVKEEE